MNLKAKVESKNPDIWNKLFCFFGLDAKLIMMPHFWQKLKQCGSYVMMGKSVNLNISIRGGGGDGQQKRRVYDNNTMTCVWRAYAKKGATKICQRNHELQVLTFIWRWITL